MRLRKTICAVLILTLLFSGCSARGKSESPSVSEAESISEESLAPKPAEIQNDTSVEAGETAYEMPETVKLTIPEGYTLARIGLSLEEKGVCTVEEFIDATQTEDFSAYPLIAAQNDNPNRCFKLEGYLFPDTYEIYVTDTPNAIITRMLDHAEQKITDDMRAGANNIGYTMDEIITIASIIEKEAFGNEQMPLISSVLHNRLNQGMQIQCDVTITYVEGAIKPFITGDIDRYNEYYNTYKCPALPAGAICNPSIDAIKAALNPAESDYLFFVTDSEENYYYSETWEGHLENVAVALGE